MVSVGTSSVSVPLAVGFARPLVRSDTMLLSDGRTIDDGVTIPVGAMTMPEPVPELTAELGPVGIGPVVAVPVSTVSIEVALVVSAADVGTVSSPDWVLTPVG